MIPRENKNNAYAKFGGTNKEYYDIFRGGLLQLHVIVLSTDLSLSTHFYSVGFQ